MSSDKADVDTLIFPRQPQHDVSDQGESHVRDQQRHRRREDIVDGLKKAPEAFIGMLDGRNFGKLIVRVAAGIA
jgi:NADPH-dependent curcumin reductase CurA